MRFTLVVEGQRSTGSFVDYRREENTMRRRHVLARIDQRPAPKRFGRGSGPGRRFSFILMLIITASLGSVNSCPAAGLVIQALNSSAKLGGIGSFDIVLINTNPAGGSSYNVASDSLDISLSGNADGITITGVSMSTSSAYIFAESFDKNHACRSRPSVSPRPAIPVSHPTIPATSSMATQATRS
jgi:hypothetical protein